MLSRKFTLLLSVVLNHTVSCIFAPLCPVVAAIAIAAAAATAAVATDSAAVATAADVTPLCYVGNLDYYCP